MKPIRPHGLVRIQVEQQTPHKFGVNWEFVVPAVTVLQLGAAGVPETSLVLKTEVKNALNVSAFSMSLFMR